MTDVAGPRFAVPLRRAMKREGLAGSTAYRRHWPRRVSRPEELDEVLPQTEEGQA